MQATGYRRVPASAAEHEATATLEGQSKRLRAAAVRAGLELVAMYTEPHEGSQQFRRMLDDAVPSSDGPTGEATAIVLPGLEVLGGTARARALRVLQLLASGIRLEVAGIEGATGLEEALRRDWAEREGGERHSERVREGMRRRALRGLALGRPPYGYRIEQRRLHIEPDEAAVVRDVVLMYLRDGLGIRRIAAALNDRGLRTRRGGPWSAAAVRDMLRNPVYGGTYRRLGVIVAGAHRAIVTAGEFEQIQRVMSGRRTAPSEQERHEYALAGLARCGYCGNRMIGVRRPAQHEGTLVYYQCESATNHGRCSYHTRRAEDLERDVLERLSRGEVTVQTIGLEDGAGNATAAELARLQTRRDALDLEVVRAVERWAGGEWSFGHLLAEAGPRACASLEAEERASVLAQAPAPSTELRAEDARERLLSSWGELAVEERRRLLQQLLVEVTVTDDAVRVAAVG